MQIKNLEIGIRTAVKAQFTAKGMSDADAEAKTTANLAAASALFDEAFAANKSSRASVESAVTYAMRAVVTWARTL